VRYFFPPRPPPSYAVLLFEGASSLVTKVPRQCGVGRACSRADCRWEPVESADPLSYDSKPKRQLRGNEGTKRTSQQRRRQQALQGSTRQAGLSCGELSGSSGSVGGEIAFLVVAANTFFEWSLLGRPFVLLPGLQNPSTPTHCLLFVLPEPQPSDHGIIFGARPSPLVRWAIFEHPAGGRAVPLGGYLSYPI
jgi:hypothetical protein